MTRTLNEHRSDINYLHERVALQLHIAAEAGNTQPTISLDQLETIVRQRLQRQGYDPREVDTITTRLVEAATHRLVLLVPEQQRVGFEVRSLQELMAAMAMTNGPETQSMDQLKLTMHHPHWRNIWLLAAGRLFKEREHLQNGIHDILVHGDAYASPLHRILPSAPMLACDILDDGFASQAPMSRRRYMHQALRAIDYPAELTPAIATSLARACQTSDDRDYIFATLTEALQDRQDRQPSAYFMAAWLGAADLGLNSRATLFTAKLRNRLSAESQQVLESISTGEQLVHDVTHARTVDRHGSAVQVLLSVLVAQHQLERETGTTGLGSDAVASLESALKSLAGRTRPAETSLSDERGSLVTQAETDDTVGVIDSAVEEKAASVLESVPPTARQTVILVGTALRPYLVRRPVGAQILQALES